MSEHTPKEFTRRRVVVTGLGAVTPLGLTVETFWNALLRGESGARPVTSFDASPFHTKFACEVQGFDPLAYFDRKKARHLDPFCHYAVAAADEALRDAGLKPEEMEPLDRQQAGIIFGSGIGGFHTLQNQAREYFEHGARRISPFFIPMIIPNMAGGVLSIRYGFEGPNHAVVSACATGNHALAEGLSLIREGQADLILCGGSEASVSEMGIGGFNAMKALSTRNNAPEAASRPFDVDRDGFVLGDGAGALVLEEAGRAVRRGARIYAELRAVGASADAYHMSAPHPEGRGIALALKRGLEEAGLTPETVDSINMHATSTPLGDESEARAVRSFFGAHADQLTATSTKSMTGHLLGAAGAIEAIATVLSMVHGVVPPTINLTHQDPACDVNIAANHAVHRTVKVALNNAFGFGGHNTCAVFSAWE
ncbi:MAG TPA: beta-ketoacyl-ACP synthase II [Thermoanaerobaculia bacterium]|jgi:3-oxoacyl-[acyl-carrier-protein] synthase II|nr:beta-ketoacyl-ACP synthase II [Thermoanaerobaculia bacterium]